MVVYLGTKVWVYRHKKEENMVLFGEYNSIGYRNRYNGV